MKIKPLDSQYIDLQDPPTRNMEQSWVKIEDLPLVGVGSVLDVGCKAGHLVHALAEAGYRAAGIDIGPSCKAYWDKHYPNLDLTWGDFLSLEIPGRYDLIVMSHVLEHLYAPHSVLDRIRSLLAPEGRVYLTFPINESYGAHYFTLESEDEIREFFKDFDILSLRQTSSSPYPIYELILK